MRLICVCLLVSSLVSGCLTVPKENVVCNTPYIRFQDDCCLDRNGNSICDADETTTTQPRPTTTTAAPTTTLPPTTTTLPPTTTTLAPTTTTVQATTTTAAPTTTLPQPTTTTEPPVCTESDGGIDEWVKGTTTRGMEAAVDKCVGSAILHEYYCGGNRIGMKQIDCTTGCDDGRCIGCEDSDGGDNPEVYGEVRMSSEWTKADKCSNIDGITLREFFCKSHTELGYRDVVCPTSCAGDYCH
ncbi:MAG: hypothetical protein GF416_01070 [Candidatus Altiarchaeales archaeon]|nr:hypothetical protein [Candidatus Altiarchaeales archaeon]MBD3415707.1 hypothetical protein [Candidatus Altiarchaeales archaeon]